MHTQAVAVPGRAALPEAKQSPPINGTNEAALTLEKQLKQACMAICNQDRTRAADLFARQYAGLSFEQRQEALLALNTPASEQQIARIDDQLMRALDLGQTRQQVDEQVSRLTNGAAFSTLTTVQIMSVIHALEIWIDGVYQEKRQAEQSPDAEAVGVANSDQGDSASVTKKAGRR